MPRMPFSLRLALVLVLNPACSSEDSLQPATSDANVATDTADDAADTAPSKCSAERTAEDRPDDVEGYQVRAFYVLPSDSKDEEHDKNGRIETAFASANAWLAKATGGPKLRLDTCEGKLDIGFLRMSKTDAEIKARGAFVLDEIQDELGPRGTKILAVYYGGGSTYSCGGGQYPPLRVGHACAMYLHGTPPGPNTCDVHELGRPDGTLGYFELGIIHEIFHTLGAAASCAPHLNEEGHVSEDRRDLLYRGSEFWDIGPQMILDIGRDDYWGHGTSCLDVSKSVFLDPLPEGARKPPKW